MKEIQGSSGLPPAGGKGCAWTQTTLFTFPLLGKIFMNSLDIFFVCLLGYKFCNVRCIAAPSIRSGEGDNRVPRAWH